MVATGFSAILFCCVLVICSVGLIVCFDCCVCVVWLVCWLVICVLSTWGLGLLLMIFVVCVLVFIT